MKRLIFSFILILAGQASFGQSLVEIPPVQAEGLPIQLIEVYIIEDGVTRILKEGEYENFLTYFNLKNKGVFHPLEYKQTKKLILAREEVIDATYKTFNDAFYGPLTIRWYITVGKPGDGKKAKGLIPTGKWSDLPMLYEDDRSELTFILNGGLGAFLDNNGFFGEGAAFTQGNPIAAIPVAFLFGGLSVGGRFVQGKLGMSFGVDYALLGVLMITLVAFQFFYTYRIVWQRHRKEKGDVGILSQKP